MKEHQGGDKSPHSKGSASIIFTLISEDFYSHKLYLIVKIIVLIFPDSFITLYLYKVLFMINCD